MYRYLRPVKALLTAVASLLCWCQEATSQDFSLAVPRISSADLRLANSLINPITASDQALETGRALFQSRCSWCHGSNGDGNGPGSDRLVPKPRDFTDTRFQELRSDGELFWVIKHGSTITKRMPAWGKLMKDQEIWALVRFLRTIPSQHATNSSADGLAAPLPR